MSSWKTWDTQVYRALTGHRPGVTLRSEPTTLPAMLATLEGVHGSQKAAAQALGVNDRTWRNWKSGRTGIGPANATKLAAAIRRLRLPAAREQRIGAAPNPVIHTISRYDGRKRKLDRKALRYHMPQLGKVVALFLTGAPMREVTKAFLDGIGEPFYEAWLNPDNHTDMGFDIERIRL